jgi:hypothetical protein
MARSFQAHADRLFGRDWRASRDGARRALVRAFLQRVEVVSKHEARVVGSRSVLFRALAVAAGAKLAKAGFGEFGDTDNSYSFSFTL